MIEQHINNAVTYVFGTDFMYCKNQHIMERYLMKLDSMFLVLTVNELTEELFTLCLLTYGDLFVKPFIMCHLKEQTRESILKLLENAKVDDLLKDNFLKYVNFIGRRDVAPTESILAVKNIKKWMDSKLEK
jgi:hypothetical protein